MNEYKITKYLLERKIINERYSIPKKLGIPVFYIRPHNYKQRIIDGNLVDMWAEFANKFRSEDEAWFCVLHKDSPDNHKCPICGNICEFNGFAYKTTCVNHSPNQVPSKIDKCRHVDTAEIKEKRRQTCLEKYGVPHNWASKNPRLNGKSGKLEKYGDENWNNREKFKQTCLERYGVTSNLLIPEVHKTSIAKSHSEAALEKKKQTNLTRYGVEYHVQSNEFIEKAKQTKQNRITKFEDEHNCTRQGRLIKTYGQGWLKLKSSFNIIYNKNICYISNEHLDEIKKYSSEIHIVSTSVFENEVASYIEQIYSGNIKRNNWDIIKNENGNNTEIDIYIPEKNVAIEFNGDYWHSTNCGKPNNYHLYKTEQCNKKGIRLIHIFEHQWANKQDICKSIIASSLGIYKTRIFARKCIVKEISASEYNEFNTEHHLHGTINASIKVGLFYNNELVQVVGIGKSRFNKKDKYELYRMTTKKFTQVIGGFSKLLNHIKYNYNIDDLISFVDRSIYTGIGYINTGWNIIEYTKPSYCYIKNGVVYNRLTCQKHKLKKMLDNFDNKLSEQENMINNGYFQIFDCGNIKLKINLT